LKFLPPTQLDHPLETEIAYQIGAVGGNDKQWTASGLDARGARDGPQRRAMQVIEMRVGDEHGVKRWKFLDAKSGTAQTFEYEKPGSKDWIDDDVRAADLQKKRRVSDERNPHLVLCGKHGAVSTSGTAGHGRVLYELAKLASFLTDTDIEHSTPLDAFKGAHDSISYACKIDTSGF